MRGALRAAVGLGGWCLAVVAMPAVADGKTDARRESVIELRFTEHPELTGRALDAEVTGDTAILTGTVKSEEDRALAEQLALASGSGIRQVDNKLTVEPPAEPAPEKNPALTSEEREERRRAVAARAREREREAETAAPEPAATPATATPAPPATPATPAPEAPAPLPARVTNPFSTAPVH